MKTVLTLFGTRPEVIKLAPVIRELEKRPDRFRAINVTSAQHTDLLYPLTSYFRIPLHHDLRVMEAGQSPAQVCARVLNSLEPILAREAPDLLLVQGDTTTVPKGFDPSAVRVVGNVTGEPPFTGSINHPGWRVKELKLAAPPEGADEFVLQPAEVQIG